jgi:hypothetical protein
MGKDSTVSGHMSLTQTTAGYLGSNKARVIRWNNELKATGWLKWDATGEKRPRLYRILNGLGVPVTKAPFREPQIELPLSCLSLPGGARSGTTEVPISADGGARSGTTANTKSKGYGVNRPSPMRECWMIEKDRQAIQSAWMEALGLPRGPERTELLKGLKKQRNELLRELAGLDGSQVPATGAAAVAAENPPCTPNAKQLTLPALSVTPDPPGPMPGDVNYEAWKKTI